ncbi:54S ribosomal protein L44, mitochondrial [Candida viswanathii]|uniref:Large ribosomal subunit protein mL53 n=1 Tax=Candida viswanathii TaxID=5486 RepID=A0A367XZZ4_9ASCO|nr:54S ribosomal protein L44, mitochondrial [Candida viswanathii]RCK62956.1 54S ribosomal protein L44, mitochondrial [Candida viswanathii]
MITKYFTHAVVRFHPFTEGARPARIFLQRLPSSTKIDCKVVTKPTDKQEIKVTFKDKHVMSVDPTTMNFEDMTDYFNVHSRKLRIQDAIQD